MKGLLENLAVETIKDTFYTGGNVCVDSTGTYLFCISTTDLNIIDINTGKIYKTIQTDEDEITSITLSSNNNYLITAHRNLVLKQWNWKEGVCIRTWKATHTAPVQCMNIDITSSLLATGSSDFTCKIWDLNAQYCTHNLKGAQGILRVIKFHPNITMELKILTGGDDSKIRIYDLKTSNLVATFEGHFSTITGFEFINKNDYLLSCSRDNVVIVWDLKKLQTIKTIPIYESIESLILLPAEKYTNYFRNISFNPEDCFLSCGNDGTIKIWNWKTAKLVYKQSNDQSLKIENVREKDSNLQQVITQGFYQETLDSIVLTTIDKLVVFVKLNEDNIFDLNKQLVGHHGEVLDITVCNKEGYLIAVATNSELIKIYNLNNWNCQLLKGHTDIVICLNSYYDNNSSYLASSSKDTSIRLWKKNHDSDIFQQIAVALGHTQDVGSVCFSKLNLKFFASASIDTTIKLWNIVQDGKTEKKYELKVLFTQKAHDKDINAINVSPNDEFLATASSDKTAKLWDASSGKCLGVFKGHKRGVWSTQFSPIEQVIATSSADSTIKLWSITDFSCIKTFEGHNTSVLKILFISNGSQLISSASDGLIKIWNIKTNECLITYDEHDDKVWALCKNGDESKYLSGGADSKLIVWKNVTNEMHEEEIENRETVLLNEQKLNNYLEHKNYKKALKLAIVLNRPFKCYQIINEILLNNKNDLKDIILKLKHDHIVTLIKYAIDWNTNSKYCRNSQTLIQIILSNWPIEQLLEINNFSNVIEQFLSYSERHFNRINNISQQIMFVDFTWSNMKFDEKQYDEKMINEK